MDVDDPALVPEDDLRREDAHVAGQDDQVHVVLGQQVEQALLVGVAVAVAHVVEGLVVALRERPEVAAVADHDGISASLAVVGQIARGLRLQEGLGRVRLLGDQQRDPAGVPVAREPDLDVHVELAPELGERAPELAPGGLHLRGVHAGRHPEDAPRTA